MLNKDEISHKEAKKSPEAAKKVAQPQDVGLTKSRYKRIPLLSDWASISERKRMRRFSAASLIATYPEQKEDIMESLRISEAIDGYPIRNTQEI